MRIALDTLTHVKKKHKKIGKFEYFIPNWSFQNTELVFSYDLDIYFTSVFKLIIYSFRSSGYSLPSFFKILFSLFPMLEAVNRKISPDTYQLLFIYLRTMEFTYTFNIQLYFVYFQKLSIFIPLGFTMLY